MSGRVLVVWMVFWVGALSAAPGDAADLCGSDLTPYFYCRLIQGGFLALCGHPNLDRPEAELRLTTGPDAGRSRVLYPPPGVDWREGFTFRHYVRPRVSLVSLSYEVDGRTRSLTDDYVADHGEARVFQGLWIDDAEGGRAELECAERAESDLLALEPFFGRR
jgi:hypothetical protein